jgi:hypothetical protein
VQWLEKMQDSGLSGTVGHVRVLTFKGLEDVVKKADFKNIKISSKGYLPLFGFLSDFFCWLDRRHGHFLIVSAEK